MVMDMVMQVVADERYDIGRDCDDDDAMSYPNAYEVCDGKDNNCNEIVDDGALDAPNWYFDGDGDGVGSSIAQSQQSCTQPEGYSQLGNDCDDQNTSVYPNAPEYCNEIDDDCDGDIDEGTDEEAPFGAPMWYGDSDEDGFFGGDATISCSAPVGFSASQEDCNDGNPDIHPNATEICNGIDDNCNNDIDDNPQTTNLFYRDNDGDGFGDENNTTSQCSLPEGFVSVSGDCNDDIANISPDADEVCNGIDDNCDTEIDNASTDALTWYRDSDGDGQGSSDESQESCTQPEGFVDNALDCDDSDEVLNRLDIDGDGIGSCDGDCDDNDASLNLDDYDNDGFGSCENDCNDFDPERSPNADETCDGVDNNCDGEVDEDTSVDALLWYIDTDGDGVGSDESTGVEGQSSTMMSCSQPEGYISLSGDCENDDASFSPNVTEICDGIDNDCDGLIDDEDDSLDVSSGVVFYRDVDEDGFGNALDTMSSCVVQEGYVENNDDCDDVNTERYLGANEYCNGLDDDCDGEVDEEDAVDKEVFYYDGDGDGSWYFRCIVGDFCVSCLG